MRAAIALMLTNANSRLPSPLLPPPSRRAGTPNVSTVVSATM